MTPTSQPQSAHVRTANRIPSYDEETARLLRIWVDLTWRATSAVAHHNGDADVLREQQQWVEDAISDRLPQQDNLLGALWAWEVGLAHEASTPVATCLICRKASLGLPPDLPLPAGLGGAR